MASKSQSDTGVVILKVVYRGDMRRHRVNINKFSFQELIELCSNSYANELQDNVVTALTYEDDEGETITVCSTPELVEAFRIASGDGRPSLRMTVSSWSAKNTGFSSKSSSKKPVAKTNSKKASTNMTKLVAAGVVPTAAVGGSVSDGKSKRQQPSSKVSKPSKPVPLRTTSGGAKLFLDGSVEFGAGGHAVMLPDGTVSCVMTGSGFPSVAAQGLLLTSGKWYHEVSTLTSGCMQIGYATKNFTGDAEAGEGVGDDKHSWAIDGYRQLKWHDSKKTQWAVKWHSGAVIGCCLDVDKGHMCFAINGQWGDTAFVGVNNKSGFMPAASFSNGELLRFNFGAPGTPFAFNPPDPSFKPVWEAFGTRHNGIEPVTSRPALFGKKASELCAQAKATYTKVDVQASRAASKFMKEADCAVNAAAATVTELLAKSGVRDAISKALSNPEVAKFVQTVLVASMKSRHAAEQAIQRNADKLVPVIIDLVAKCPELLATVPQIISAMMRKGNSSCRNWRKHCKGPDLNRMFSNVSRRTQDVAGLIVQWLGTAAASANAAAFAPATACSSSEQDSKTNSTGEVDAVDKDLQAAIEESLRQSPVQTASASAPVAPAAADAIGNSNAVFVAALPKLAPPSNGPLPLSLIACPQRPKARFLKEFSSANKKELEVGQGFTHTWQLVNNGTEAWPTGVVAKRTTGDEMKGTDAVIQVAPAAPNTSVYVKIDVVAPTKPGRYISYWRLFNGDQAFGDRIWVDITVKAEKASTNTSADAVEGLTDWVAVADSMRASGSGISESLLNVAASSKSESKSESNSGVTGSIACNGHASRASVGVKTNEAGPQPSAPLAVSAAALASAAASATTNSSADLTSKYSKQMKLMQSMGFGGENDLVLAILESTNGDIGQAVNRLLANSSSS